MVELKDKSIHNENIVQQLMKNLFRFFLIISQLAIPPNTQIPKRITKIKNTNTEITLHLKRARRPMFFIA
jgi:hypothetical protein